MTNNINWTLIPNKDILRFGRLSHLQHKKRGLAVKDYVEVWLRCESCDKAKKFEKVKVGHSDTYAWDLKDWKTFIRKGQVLKDEERGTGYYFYTRVEFWCSPCSQEVRERGF